MTPNWLWPVKGIFTLPLGTVSFPVVATFFERRLCQPRRPALECLRTPYCVVHVVPIAIDGDTYSLYLQHRFAPQNMPLLCNCSRSESTCRMAVVGRGCVKTQKH